MGNKLFPADTLFPSQPLRSAAPIIVTLLFSTFLTWCYGALLTAQQIQLLKERARFIEEIPFAVSLPSQSLLFGLPMLFSFNCGAFFGLTLGPFLGVLFVLTLLMTKSVSQSARLLTAVFAAYAIILCLTVGAELSSALSLLFCLSFPFVLYLSYQAASGFISRLEEKSKQRLQAGVYAGNERGFKRGQLVSFLSLTLFFLSIIYLSTPLLRLVSVKSDPNTFIAVRDQLLLGNPLGRIINNYYYKHSPYAAEVIKPLNGKNQFSILYLGKDKGSSLFFQREQKNLRYFVRFVSHDSGLDEYVRMGGIDLVFADMDSIRGESLYHRLASLGVDTGKRVVFLTTDKEYQPPGLRSKPAIIVKPLTLKKINSAIKTVSSSIDHARGLRKLIGLSLHGYLPLTVIGLLFTLPALFVLAVFILYNIFYKLVATNPGVVSLIVLILLAAVSVYKKVEEISYVLDVSRQLAVTESNTLKAHLNFLGSKNPEIRSIATRNLYQLTKSAFYPGVIRYVTPLLSDPDPRVRMYGVSILGNSGTLEMFSYLVTMMDDPNINVRYKTVEAMGKVGGSEATAFLKEVLAKESEWYLSNYALHALREAQAHI